MLNVVMNFSARSKILITPGIVELGKVQYRINKEIAKLSSDVFDEIWVLNEVNKKAFKDAEINNKCRMHFYDNLSNEIFNKLYSYGLDTLVVIENDLPDIYV